jgi:DNA-directed RNA polymerase specialized sigma24 family protein
MGGVVPNGSAPQRSFENSTASRNSEGSVTFLLARLRSGDREATGPLWERFFPRLYGLARKTLAGQPQRVADADDAAVSAFASFWRRAERGDFPDVLDRDSLWNILGTITVRKARKQVRREQAQKRGGGNVLGENRLSGAEGAGELPLDEALGRLPAVEFDLYCEELLLMLDEPLRQIALLRLMGHTNHEIADLLECTDRKIQRKLQLIRLKWEHAVAENGSRVYSCSVYECRGSGSPTRERGTRTGHFSLAHASGYLNGHDFRYLNVHERRGQPEKSGE